MRWPPLSTTTNRWATRGFSLIELTISTTLFLLVSTVLLSLFQTSQRATDKAIENTDLTSRMMILFDKVRNETRGVRILGPTTEGRLEYWKVREVGGIPQLTALGRPDYLPGTPQPPDRAYLYLRDGMILSDFQGTTRSLVSIGEDSALVFGWNAANHILTISGHLANGSVKNGFFYQMYVSNNE